MPDKKDQYSNNAFKTLWCIVLRVNIDTGQIKNCTLGYVSLPDQEVSKKNLYGKIGVNLDSSTIKIGT